MRGGALRGIRAAAIAAGAALALGACAFGPPDPDQAGEPPNLPAPSAASAAPGDDGDSEIAATVLAKGLAVPSGIAFLPDGTALVTERDSGRILQVGPQTDKDGLKVTPTAQLPDVEAGGDGGLMGIAVSPKYRTDKTVYLYYSTAEDNRVATMQLGGKPQPILTGIPHSPNDNGGAIAFGPDGDLYVGTGDGTPTGTQAGDPKSLGGKILRMTPEGKPVADNPVKNSLVWSSGHRNVQGFAWDSSKRMYASESDQKVNGELNLIEKGKNYGWPAADGTAGRSKLADPVATWPIVESSCAGVAVLERMVATACLQGKRIWLVNTTANGTQLGQPQPVVVGEYGRLRALVAAPDGSLWVGTSNQEKGGDPIPDDDRLIRLVFSDGGAGRS